MNEYRLINSKAIREHCEKIKHKFNTEELAVLIYRNKEINIEEKIKLYQELIEKYPDMEVIERINCKHYDSVKDMIRREIARIQELTHKLVKEEENVIYTYNSYWSSNNRIIEGKNEYGNIYKTFKEVEQTIEEELKENEKYEENEDEVISYRITKQNISNTKKYRIGAEYIINQEGKIEMINIYDFEDEWLDISNICLNIPTPFKKGDLLLGNSKTPFSEGYVLTYNKFPFVLEHLCTWNEKFQELLDKGNHDSSDMQGLGDLISDEDRVYCDNVFDYDSWEYFDGKLEGMSRILRGISNLIKGEINVELLLSAYDSMKAECEKNRTYLDSFLEEGLKLAGFNDEDLEEK